MKVNITGFMQDMGIDDFDDILSLYQDYIIECGELIDKIQINNSASTLNEWIDLAKDIHNIKGVSANLYVQEVCEKATCLEHYLKALIDSKPFNHQYIVLCEDLSKSFEDAKNEINHFFNLRM